MKIILRATGHDSFYRPQLEELGIEDIVEIKSGVTYREALVEMLSADGLLLLQATNSNHQVPAKLYEYFRAGRPILALTDPSSDTANELTAVGTGMIAPLDDATKIAEAMMQFVRGIQSGEQTGATRSEALRYSRTSGAEKLAQILEAATENPNHH